MQNEFEITSALDQAEANLINVSKLAGSFYKRLIDQGLPDEVAQEMVLYWHEVLWGTNTGYNYGGDRRR